MTNSTLPASPPYVPPYPFRPSKAESPLRMVRRAQRNILAVWPNDTFECEAFSYRVLWRKLHIVNTPEAVRQLFVDGSEACSRKTAQQRHALAPLVGDGLIISDGDTWRQRRRAVAPVTHVSRLPEFSGAMTAGASDMVRKWEAMAPGQEVDLLEEMAKLAAGIIIAAICGQDVDPVVAERIVGSFSDYQRSVKSIDFMSLFAALDDVPRFFGLRVNRAAARIRRDLERVIDDVLRKTDAGSSLIRAMAEAQFDGKPAMDREGFRNEAAVMFLAGHETTANTLAWTFFILSQDPETERRLHAEVDAVLVDRAATVEDLPRLPFSRAIIQETLRLYPPVPIQARTATKDTKMGAEVVRAGDPIMLNAWLLHRHRKVWTDPDAFVPDRFMPGGTGIPSRYAYVPFSIGPRTCTGASFGQAEAIICLASLARRFQPRLRPGFVVDPVCRLSLRPGHTLPMRLERR